MKRRGFFTLLLAPIVARFAPAQKPYDDSGRTLDETMADMHAYAEQSTYDLAVQKGYGFYRVASDPQLGISIRLIREWKPEHDLALNAFDVEMVSGQQWSEEQREAFARRMLSVSNTPPMSCRIVG